MSAENDDSRRRDYLPMTYANVIGALRDEARKLGYAIGIHGSMRKDLDLMAVPWIEDAASPEELFEAIRKVVGGYVVEDGTPGGRFDAAQQKFVPAVVRQPDLRPHGRLAYEIHLGHIPSIDLSVMPRIIKPPISEEEAFLLAEAVGHPRTISEMEAWCQQMLQKIQDYKDGKCVKYEKQSESAGDGSGTSRA